MADIIGFIRANIVKSRCVTAGLQFCSNKYRRKLLGKIGWTVGDRSIIHWGVIPTAKNVRIGHDVVVGSGALFDGMGTITIEDGIRIGPMLKILCTTHPVEPGLPRRIAGKDLDLDTVIEYGCWIGASTLILPGVVIRRGCVIAAGSVVTKSTEPNGLYAGVPARRIKDLPTAYDDQAVPAG